MDAETMRWVVVAVFGLFQFLSYSFIAGMAREIKESRNAGVEQGRILAALAVDVQWLKLVNERRKDAHNAV